MYFSLLALSFARFQSQSRVACGLRNYLQSKKVTYLYEGKHEKQTSPPSPLLSSPLLSSPPQPTPLPLHQRQCQVPRADAA